MDTTDRYLANRQKTEFSFSSRGLRGLIERRLGIDVLFEQQLASEIRALAAAESKSALDKRLDDVTQMARHANGEIARVDFDVAHQGRRVSELGQNLRNDLGGVEQRLNVTTGATEALARRLENRLSKAEETNGGLASRIAEAEAALGKRLDRVVLKAEQSDAQISNVRADILRQGASITELEQRLRDDLEGVTRRVNELTETSGALAAQVASVEAATRNLEISSAEADMALGNRLDDVTRIAQQADAGLARIGYELAQQNELFSELELDLREEITAFVERFHQLEAEGSTLRNDLGNIARHVDDVNKASAALTERINTAETALGNRVAEVGRIARHVDAQITRIDTTIAQHRGRIDRAVGVGQISRYMHPKHSRSPKFFLVTTLGYSASRWLAKTLHQIDGVVCTHGRNDPELGLVYDRNFRVKEWKKVWQDMPSRKTLSLNGFFEELQSVGPADAYGNVHHYGIAEINQKLEHEQCEFEFRSCDLIRHPVSVVESRYQAHLDPKNPNNRFEKGLTTFHSSMPQYVEEMGLRNLVERHKLETSDEHVSMFFRALEGARWMTSAVDTYPAHKYIPMEEVVASPDTFCTVAEYLLGSDFELPKKQIEDNFTRERLNQHRSHRKRGGPAGDFKNWKAWQKDAARFYFERDRTAEVFSGFGYDFSFMN